MMEGLRVLTVLNFGETEAENDRITLNSMEIQMTAARDDIRQGRAVKKTTVMFKDGACVELFLNEMDLLTVEQAIGTYGFLEG